MSNLVKGGALVGEVMPDEPMRITVNSNDAFDADAVQQLYETMLASCALDVTPGAAAPSVRITIR